LIGGFIVTGTQPKKIIVRGIGPSLPVPGALANPTLELYDSFGQTIATNDNWGDSVNRQEIIDTTLAPASANEAAILVTLPPAAYTAIVRGINGSTGVALVEIYDLSVNVDAQLANISTRASVQTGNNVLIGGFIVLGQQSGRVIVRAIGPSIPLAGGLADPTLELHDGNGTQIAANNNWRTDHEAEISATALAPTNDAESAIVTTLAPALYTAIVQGANGTTGVGLVEVYNLH
jgi:hypothetical protein